MKGKTLIDLQIDFRDRFWDLRTCIHRFCWFLVSVQLFSSIVIIILLWKILEKLM